MTSRTEFLARISAGLGRSSTTAAIAPPPPVDDNLVRLTAPDDAGTLADTFATSAAAASLIVHRTTPHDAASTIRELLASLGVRRIVLDALDPTLAPIATAALSGSPAEIIDPRTTPSLDRQFDADMGITGVVAAIAETGTLVLASDAVRSRGPFIIPPVHLALVREDQIIPDLVDLWPIIGSHPPTALTLVSGPSKTADIEGILVTGVHGPGAVHIILIEPHSSEPSSSEPSRGVTP